MPSDSSQSRDTHSAHSQNRRLASASSGSYAAETFLNGERGGTKGLERMRLALEETVRGFTPVEPPSTEMSYEGQRRELREDKLSQAAKKEWARYEASRPSADGGLASDRVRVRAQDNTAGQGQTSIQLPNTSGVIKSDDGSCWPGMGDGSSAS